MLDHALVTQNLVNYVSRVSYSRSNADQPETQRGNPNTPARLTDHDGVVVAFAMGAPRLVGQVVAKTAGAATIDVRFTNSGTGNVIDGRVEGITFRTMAGIGTVTLVGRTVDFARRDRAGAVGGADADTECPSWGDAIHGHRNGQFQVRRGGCAAVLVHADRHQVDGHALVWPAQGCAGRASLIATGDCQ